MKPLAAIDIGSNTILLTIADNASGDLVASVDECHFARLAEGLSRTGELSPAAIDRGLAVLRQYRAAIDKAGCETVKAVATQAVREAKNATDFTTAATEILGSPIDVIDGNREAQLVARAVIESVPGCKTGKTVIVDVGGASTEIITVDDGRVQSTISIPIGAVRLTEDHIASDPPTPAELSKLRKAVDEALNGADLPPVDRVIGSAGTATTIAAIELELGNYDAARVHGYSLPPKSVKQIFTRLAGLTLAERVKVPGLEPKRADVAPAGVAIYVRALARCQAYELCVSDRGVRWGLLYESLG